MAAAVVVIVVVIVVVTVVATRRVGVPGGQSMRTSRGLCTQRGGATPHDCWGYSKGQREEEEEEEEEEEGEGAPR
jgi:hypothetical protein